MSDREYHDVPVIALDIEASSRHPGLEQGAMHRELRRLFDSACAEVQLTVDEGDRADRGDGDNIVVRSGFPVERLVADLARELAGALDQLNRGRNEAGRLRIRMAVHRGPVWGKPGRWDGHAVVDARRILDAAVPRSLLANHPSAAMVMTTSQAVFDGTVRERLRHLDPALWTPFEVGDLEKGAGIRGWSRLLGQGAPAGAVLARNEPDVKLGAAGESASDSYRAVSGSSGTFSLGDGSPAVGTNFGRVEGHRG